MNEFNMQAFHPAEQVSETDLVCGMKVDPQNPPFKMRYQDKTYYFCSGVCRHLFEREPEKYVKINES